MVNKVDILVNISLQFTLSMVDLNFFFEWKREGIYYLYLLFLFCVIMELTTLIFQIWTEIFFHHVDV